MKYVTLSFVLAVGALCDRAASQELTAPLSVDAGPDRRMILGGTTYLNGWAGYGEPATTRSEPYCVRNIFFIFQEMKKMFLTRYGSRPLPPARLRRPEDGLDDRHVLYGVLEGPRYFAILLDRL